MAPWARTRIRSRSSARRRTTTPRAISSTTRRKSGAMTVSHLRFGPRPIHSTYLITPANFIACHQFQFLERIDVLRLRRTRRNVPAQRPFGADEVWDHLPRRCRTQIIEKKLKFYRDRCVQGRARDRNGRAHQHHHADLLLRHQRRVCRATRRSRRSRMPSAKPTAKRGEAVVQKNFAAVDQRSSHLSRGQLPGAATQPVDIPAPVPEQRAGVRAKGDGR